MLMFHYILPLNVCYLVYRDIFTLVGLRKTFRQVNWGSDPIPPGSELLSVRTVMLAN